jgi:hypothetical protein
MLHVSAPLTDHKQAYKYISTAQSCMHFAHLLICELKNFKRCFQICTPSGECIFSCIFHNLNTFVKTFIYLKPRFIPLVKIFIVPGGPADGRTWWSWTLTCLMGGLYWFLYLRYWACILVCSHSTYLLSTFSKRCSGLIKYMLILFSFAKVVLPMYSVHQSVPDVAQWEGS